MNTFAVEFKNKDTNINVLSKITMEVKKIMQSLEQKHPGEAEYLQAVQEVLESIEEVYTLSLKKPRL